MILIWLTCRWMCVRLWGSNRQSVAELVARRPNTTLYGPMPSLAGLIARADFAIGAGGSTTWESLSSSSEHGGDYRC